MSVTAQQEEITEASVGNKEFLSIIPHRLKNDERGTLLIEIKSEVLEDFFLSMSPDKEDIAKGDYSKCRYMQKAKNEKGDPIYLIGLDKAIKGMTGKYEDNFALTDFQTPNMTMLTAVGLKSGVSFIFDGMYTSKTINDTLLNMYRRALEIYNEYAKPISLEIQVFIKETK